MLSHTSTEWAPWHVIPADRKWFARIGAAAVLVDTLMEIDPRFPPVSGQQRDTLREAKRQREEQAPKGAPQRPLRAGAPGQLTLAAETSRLLPTILTVAVELGQRGRPGGDSPAWISSRAASSVG
jgi:hypothetical protein